LRHWNNPEREGKHRLFFCEREAAETVIWLIETPASSKTGIKIPKDVPTDRSSIDRGYASLTRYCSKMATGSGKTVVMAMLIAWSVLNKVFNKQDRRFSDAVLIVCPNLTIKERLRVLYPSEEDNFYQQFNVVPASFLPLLSKARIMITNWHLFLPEDDSLKRNVLQRGEESDSAFCGRVLRNLGEKENLLVINDEAHHAYRLPPSKEGTQQAAITQGLVGQVFEEESEEATVWVGALDRVNKARGINICLDLSATPFYIKGTGHLEGSPFPWIVSDFGLVDAIESGIVKIPRVPVDDNSGQPIPRYFRLWQWIMDQLPSVDRSTTTRRAKPEAVLRQAQAAIVTLANEWKKTFENFLANDRPIPPVMIVVCDNTDLAEVVHTDIASGHVFSELTNQNAKEVTIRIDSKLLEKAESVTDPSISRVDIAEELRRKVATIGKMGEPGEQVRCVVSVMMLNEGWDAQNVTQILGLRAFDSQLLCEQVVGRGLRRTNYDDFSSPEYVDVYGIPFEVIPVQKGSTTRSEPENIPTLVKALPERKDLEIRFPRVEGYIFDVKQKVTADIDRTPPLYVDPSKEPTEVLVKGQVGTRFGRPSLQGPGKEVREDRDLFHKTHRLQTTTYEIAAEVTQKLNQEVRPFVFPQVLDITRRYLSKRVKVRGDAVLEEVALKKYKDTIVSRLCDAIRPDVAAGEAPILPRIERYRPSGSTSEVLFRTVKDVHDTGKSHVSHVVVDSGWEWKVAFEFEKSPYVVSYVKNDHLDFAIPYEYEGTPHNYLPDFIVRMKTEDGVDLNMILEVKGFEDEKARAKKTAAQRWVEAVNHHGGYGKWELHESKSPNTIAALINKIAKTPSSV
jgi:type III restriction enzyme